MKVNFKIRDATKKDVPVIMDLARQLAVYEKSPESFVGTRDDFERWGWGPDSIFKVLLAENAGDEGPEYVGMALYYFTFSTWTGRPTLWLEDVFVPEELRGSGVGSALLGRLAKIALEKGCARMEWTCLDWNEPSRQFYFRLGAQAMEGWTTFRLTPKELEKMAR